MSKAMRLGTHRRIPGGRGGGQDGAALAVTLIMEAAGSRWASIAFGISLWDGEGLSGPWLPTHFYTHFANPKCGPTASVVKATRLVEQWSMKFPQVWGKRPYQRLDLIHCGLITCNTGWHQAQLPMADMNYWALIGVNCFCLRFQSSLISAVSMTQGSKYLLEMTGCATYESRTQGISLDRIVLSRM